LGLLLCLPQCDLPVHIVSALIGTT
jgi:hypothetical protein